MTIIATLYLKYCFPVNNPEKNALAVLSVISRNTEKENEGEPGGIAPGKFAFYQLEKAAFLIGADEQAGDILMGLILFHFHHFHVVCDVAAIFQGGSQARFRPCSVWKYLLLTNRTFVLLWPV
jgi:hypothetical protein